MSVGTCETELAPSHARGIISKMITMVVAAIAVSAALIFFSNSTLSEGMKGFANNLELASVALMPYLISAAIAAITAAGILAILPFYKLIGLYGVIQYRLRQLADGDLRTRVQAGRCSGPARDVVKDLNFATGEMGKRVAELKLFNRQQWELLEIVRHAIQHDDKPAALQAINKMEIGWGKIARIEQELAT